jgi:hypothetical protein
MQSTKKNSSLAPKIYENCGNISDVPDPFFRIPNDIRQIHSDDRAEHSSNLRNIFNSFTYLPPQWNGFSILNLTVISYIGVLSYSLYIWQEPFLFAFPFPVPIGLLLTFAVAACSYHFLEKPVAALRQRLRPKELQALANTNLEPAGP